MIKHWWKILAVIVLLYTIVVGMMVPLKPGILEVYPITANTGENINLKVTGYNSHYLDSKQKPRVWLKYDSIFAIPAAEVNLINNARLDARFNLPNNVPSGKEVTELSMIIHNEKDGPSLLPSAIFLKQTKNAAPTSWQSDIIKNLSLKEGIQFPYRWNLQESIRNIYYHVPMWFAMMLILLAAAIYSFLYLRTKEDKYDHLASSYSAVGLLLGILGLVTGMVWAKYTWGKAWSWDVKQNVSAISLLIYCAYFILRSSVDDDASKKRLSSVYNIYAFIALVPLLFVIPRLSEDSLHPGNGGNPAMGGEDLDNTMRLVFYPAVIAWTLFSAWMANLFSRIKSIREKLDIKKYEILS